MKESNSKQEMLQFRCLLWLLDCVKNKKKKPTSHSEYVLGWAKAICILNTNRQPDSTKEEVDHHKGH